MAEQEKDKQLDELLDSMLSRYAAEEPRPGLETRVLAQIAEDARNSESRIRRSSWFIPCVGFTAATTALLMMLLAFRTTQVRRPLPELGQNGHPPQLFHPDTSVRPASTPSSTNKPIHTKKSSRMRVAGVVSSQKADDPLALAQRPAVFPTPVPLSPQERLMFAYIENTPRSEVDRQIKSDDQKEARAFWAAGEPLLQGKDH